MRRYDVGATVQKGYYLNLKSFELLTIDREGGVLRGAVGGQFVKLLYYASKALYRLAVRGVLAVAPAGAGQVAHGGATTGASRNLGQDMTDRRSGRDDAE
jgi:hypothetical protein